LYHYQWTLEILISLEQGSFAGRWAFSRSGSMAGEIPHGPNPKPFVVINWLTIHRRAKGISWAAR
jgi:hypothetical protein